MGVGSEHPDGLVASEELVPIFLSAKTSYYCAQVSSNSVPTKGKAIKWTKMKESEEKSRNWAIPSQWNQSVLSLYRFRFPNV